MFQRLRRRYLALKVESEQTIQEKDVMNAVWTAIFQLFGEHGASQATLALIEYNQQKGYAIMRCSHKALEIVRASIASITEINEKTVAVHVLGVSGTLRALRKKHSL